MEIWRHTAHLLSLNFYRFQNVLSHAIVNATGLRELTSTIGDLSLKELMRKYTAQTYVFHKKFCCLIISSPQKTDEKNNKNKRKWTKKKF